MFLGSTQAQRLIELSRASKAGDIIRILCLLEAGVDVDAPVNDYGHTAVFQACYHNQLVTVEFLVGSFNPVPFRVASAYI